MKRSLLIQILLAVFIPIILMAEQAPSDKIGLTLKRMLSGQIYKTSAENVRVFVDGENAAEAVREASGWVNTDQGYYITASMPLDRIMELADKVDVHRIRLGRRMRKLNDQAAQAVRADDVWNGQAPLNQAYTGEGVVVGIIDSGIDIDHADFKNTDGSTRILSIWDQNESGTTPSGYSYGMEWTAAQINSGACTHEDPDGHGTHVAGSAAGNGQAVGTYSGMAPGAHIVMVALNFENSTGVVDGANYIYQIAQNLGLPCVINASLGSHGGPHDGSGDEPRRLDLLLKGQSGRAFCAAAGNEGADNIHVGSSSNNLQWTYFNATDEYGEIWIYIRVPNSMINTVEFAIGADSSDYNPITFSGGPLETGGMTPYYTTQTISDNAKQENLGNDVGTVFFQASAVSDSVSAVLIQIADVLDWDWDTGEVGRLDLWRLYIKNGNSRIHAWVADVGQSYPGTVGDAQYTAADNDYSVGLPATGMEIIAVGAYTNRTQFTDKDGNLWGLDGSVHDIAPFSSMGPSADGRIKPEITAPGHGIISSLSVAAEQEGAIYPEEIVQGGKHANMSGTSMSSPITAGCLALYFQKYPSATNAQVRSALASSAIQDGYTGSSLPNNIWGWGKLDVFSMLGTTAVQDDAIKPNRFMVDAAYPNPFNPSATIDYHLSQPAEVKIDLFDTLGRIIEESVIRAGSNGSYRYVIDGENLHSGIYFVRFEALGYVTTQKVILIK
ncbi:S8 family peptidase [bacterium]|nr:S8 family peptidase [bacterium]